MDLDLERIAFGSVVGVTGAAVAAGASRESNQQINLREKFDEIAGPNGACFHEVLMRVARIPSAHEYVHHVVDMSFSFFERQIPLARDGPRQIRMTAMVGGCVRTCFRRVFDATSLNRKAEPRAITRRLNQSYVRIAAIIAEVPRTLIARFRL